MKEGFPEPKDVKFLRAELEQVTFLADGRRITEGHVNSLNMSKDEVRDTLKDGAGACLLSVTSSAGLRTLNR